MTHQRPLDGLRVLDLSRALSGPFAGRILADLGADVVKVELPGADIAQTYGKVIRGRSGLYSQLNAGKRSILLDLRQPGDAARLLDLATASGGRWSGCPTGSATPHPDRSAASRKPASTPRTCSASGPAARPYRAPGSRQIPLVDTVPLRP
jgi:CoA-transferase family III